MGTQKCSGTVTKTKLVALGLEWNSTCGWKTQRGTFRENWKRAGTFRARRLDTRQGHGHLSRMEKWRSVLSSSGTEEELWPAVTWTLHG